LGVSDGHCWAYMRNANLGRDATEVGQQQGRHPCHRVRRSKTVMEVSRMLPATRGLGSLPESSPTGVGSLQTNVRLPLLLVSVPTAEAVPEVANHMDGSRGDHARSADHECRLVGGAPVPELKKAEAKGHHAYQVYDREANNHHSIVTRFLLRQLRAVELRNRYA
jgi:hypothetical protein